MKHETPDKKKTTKDFIALMLVCYVAGAGSLYCYAEPALKMKWQHDKEAMEIGKAIKADEKELGKKALELMKENTALTKQNETLQIAYRDIKMELGGIKAGLETKRGKN